MSRTFNTINNFEPANELFLYCYYELYLESKEKQYLDKINYYLNIVNTNEIKIKKDIEKELDNIYKIQIKLWLINALSIKVILITRISNRRIIL